MGANDQVHAMKLNSLCQNPVQTTIEEDSKGMQKVSHLKPQAQMRHSLGRANNDVYKNPQKLVMIMVTRSFHKLMMRASLVIPAEPVQTTANKKQKQKQKIGMAYNELA